MIENCSTLRILCDFGDFEAKTATFELVDRSYVPALMHSLSDNDDSATGEWQTGYKTGLIGNTIHFFTILMLCGFQIILATSRRTPDEERVRALSES